MKTTKTGPKKGAKKRGKRGPYKTKSKLALALSTFKVINGVDLDGLRGSKGKNEKHLRELVPLMETMAVSKTKAIPVGKDNGFDEKTATSITSSALRHFANSKGGHSFTVRTKKDASDRFVSKLIFRIG